MQRHITNRFIEQTKGLWKNEPVKGLIIELILMDTSAQAKAETPPKKL